MIVLNAFGESLSNGEMKFPAALFITIFGNPSSASIASNADLTTSGSLTSPLTANTCEEKRTLM